MTWTIRVLKGGRQIESSPVRQENGIAMATLDPDAKELLTWDFTGWLDGETISSTAWTGTNLTLSGTATSSAKATAFINAVPLGGSGDAKLEVTSSTGRIIVKRFVVYGIES